MDVPFDNPDTGNLLLSVVAVQENTVYQLGEGHKLVISSLPDSHLESIIYFSTGASSVEIDILQNHKQIEERVTEPAKSYVMSIANRHVIMVEAVSVEV